MFAVDDYIICGKNGVCRVEAVGTMELAGMASDRLYYTLMPIYSNGSRVFTPVDNDKLVIRSVMTADEVNALIDEMPSIEELVIVNEKHREQQYKALIKDCDARQLVSMLKTLRHRKEECLANNKKVHNVDDKYTKLGEEYLYGEIGCVLGMDRTKVPEYIDNRINKQN